MNVRSLSFGSVVLIGAVASGKSTVARLLSDELSWPVLSFGAYVRDQAARHGIPPHRDELERLGAHLITTCGHDNFLRDVLGTHASTAPFILEGVRHVDMLRAVERAYPSTVSIYLDVPPDVRYERWLRRQELVDSPARRASFDGIAQGEVERHVHALLNVVDYVVDATRPARFIATDILDLLQPSRS